MSSNFHKPVQSVISTRKETLTSKTIMPTSVKAEVVFWSLVTRANTTNWETNYTSSFNLPFERDAFASGSTLSLAYPELQQLNTETFLMATIHPNHYNEMIDGRSVVVTVPSGSGSITCVSSTYNILAKSEDNVLLGKNIAFLFCDSINRPYTGTTDGGATTRAAVTSWSASSYLDRPAAVSYQNLQATDLNTDQRPWASVNTAVRVPQTYPTNTNQGYNYDIPVGFVALDKGFVIITHPALVTGVTWNLGQQLVGNAFVSNAGSLTTNIAFSANSNVSFYDVDIEYKTTVVTTALPGEFYFSSNPTWDYESNLSEYQLGSNNFTTTYVTEIGLYNANNELIAIAKLDRPKEKGYVGVMTFSLQIDV